MRMNGNWLLYFWICQQHLWKKIDNSDSTHRKTKPNNGNQKENFYEKRNKRTKWLTHENATCKKNTKVKMKTKKIDRATNPSGTTKNWKKHIAYLVHFLLVNFSLFFFFLSFSLFVYNVIPKKLVLYFCYFNFKNAMLHRFISLHFIILHQHHQYISI